MVSSVGVIAIPMWPVVAMRLGTMLLPCAGMGKASLGGVPARELFSEEALKFSETTSCAARPGPLAARCCGDACNRRATFISEVSGVGRIGTPSRRL